MSGTASASGAVALVLLLASWAAVCSSATVPFQMAVITAQTGAWTDWYDTVSGYQFWLSRVLAISPNGIPIQDSKGNTYYFPVTMNVYDDQSNATLHTALVTAQSASGAADFILNANPSFALSETPIVSAASKINLQPVTANANAFGDSLFGAYGVAAASSGYFTALFQSYKTNNILNIGVAYRTDNDELKSACVAAELVAKQNLISYVDIPYSATDSLATIANTISASSIFALVACVPSSDAATLFQSLDSMRKPLKNVFFTNGPNNQTWNGAIGAKSVYLTAPALWASTVSGTDALFGTASNFNIQFSTLYGRAPSDYAAAGAAAAYALYVGLTTAFSVCDLTNVGSNAQLLLYSTTDLSCSDNLNNGMQRLTNQLRLKSINSFFGTIGFASSGQTYSGIIATVQVFSATKNLKQAYAPLIVSPISEEAATLVLPQPNRYAPVCPPGSYQNPDDYSPCILCPPGQYQSLSGQTACEVCPKSTYYNASGATQCLVCPDNTVTAERGATNATDCICQVGFYNQAGQGGIACVDCPINADCAGGTSWPTPQTGWYAETFAPFIMYNCNPNLVCVGNFTCAAGYAGRMCAYCDTANGYFMALSRCYKCPSKGTIIFYMALMMAGFIILNTGITRSVETFIILVNFCQILSLINMFNANWSNTLSNLMNFASILAFEPDCIQPQCLNPDWNYSNNLMFQLLMPLIILGFTLLWTGFTYATFRIKMLLEGGRDKDEVAVDSSFATSFTASASRVESRTSEEGGLFDRKNAASNVTFGRQSMGSLTKYNVSGWMLVLQSVVSVPGSRSEMYEVILDRASIPLMFLNASYMATLKYCLSAFYCHDFAGTKYVYYMPRELCYSPKHYEMMMMAMGGLVVYCLGLWALIIHVLMHLKRTRSFGDKVPLLMFGWIYDMFDIKYYWFEVVSLSQRTTMTLIMVFMLDYTDVQLFVAFLLTGAVLIIQVRTSAISDFTVRTMDTIGDTLLLIIIVIGMLLDNSSILPNTADGLNNLMFSIVIGYLCAAGIIIVVDLLFLLWTSILMSRHNNIAKKWGHKIKHFHHMYKVFTPWFMIRWLSKAKSQDWQDWHRLGLLLADYVHPTSETSHLSNRKVGRFWRFLLSSFPEILDYLATVSTDEREHFNRFIESMYMDFFDTAEEHEHQLNSIVQNNYQAPFAQWLSQADEKELEFLRQVTRRAYESVKGKKAGMELARAMTRSMTRSMTGKSNGASSGGVKMPVWSEINASSIFSDEIGQGLAKAPTGQKIKFDDGSDRRQSMEPSTTPKSPFAQAAGVPDVVPKSAFAQAAAVPAVDVSAPATRTPTPTKEAIKAALPPAQQAAPELDKAGEAGMGFDRSSVDAIITLPPETITTPHANGSLSPTPPNKLFAEEEELVSGGQAGGSLSKSRFAARPVAIADDEEPMARELEDGNNTPANNGVPKIEDILKDLVEDFNIAQEQQKAAAPGSSMAACSVSQDLDEGAEQEPTPKMLSSVVDGNANARQP